MRSERDSEVRRAIAIVSLLLLVSMASAVTLVSSGSASDKGSNGHTFVGTTPDAPATPENLPPTF